jgi:hypothetical protein
VVSNQHCIVASSIGQTVDVEKAVGVRIFVRRAQAVASVLELGQALPPGRYRPHYRSSLGPVDGSEVSPPD